jgi:hypothetical protein
MIPGFVPFAGAQPVGSDSPEADLGLDLQHRDLMTTSFQMEERADDADTLAVAAAPDGRVVVDIRHDLAPDAMAALLDSLGAELYRVIGPDLVEAFVPADRLSEMRQRPGVDTVQLPPRPSPEPSPTRSMAVPLASPITGEEVAATGADAWHAAGYRGGGVKVGILDNWFSTAVWDAAEAAGEVPEPAGVICRVSGASCDLWSMSPGGEHGTALAEIVHEMAPEAELYLGWSLTPGDRMAVLDYLASQGVQVVLQAMTWPYDGPGDGTGIGATIVDHATSLGMTWVNMAGNLAGGAYWRGPWVDTNGNGFLEFAAGDESFDFYCGWGYGLRWDDWMDAVASDYDVFIFEDPDAWRAGITKAESREDQVAGADPVEWYNTELLAAGCDGDFDVDHLAVGLVDPGAGVDGDVLELGVNTYFGEYWQNAYSATIPFAATANPGALSVGAIDPPLGAVAGSYSSRGPTNDERMKPDLTAAAGVLNFTWGTIWGTGAAAATAAGAAALVLGAIDTDLAALAVTPTQVASFLTSNATVDRGVAGPDNTYGHGELVLPAPLIAVDDEYDAATDTLLTVSSAKGVLANDTDPGGGTLTVSKSDTKSSKGGTVSVKSDGSFTYMPPASFVGTDSFGYTVSNGLLNNSATVTLDVRARIHTVGLVDPAQGKWYLYNEAGVQQKTFFYGNPGDFPIYGDWNCNGEETPGMYRQSDGFVYLRDSNTQGVGDTRFFFGNPGDIPLAGDFNGDGCDTVSIYRAPEQRFYIINELGENEGGLGEAEFSYVFGDPGDKPFVGDFDGDGIETVGLHRESTGLVYFRNSHTQGVADEEFIFGDPGDRLVAGDWTGDGVFSPALFRPSNTTMFFRYTNTQGNADAQWVGGQSPWLPIAGNNGLG